MNRRQEQRNNEEGNAVGGDANARFDLNQLVDRLREFLVNVDQNFPAAANNENDEDQENYFDEEFD